MIKKSLTIFATTISLLLTSTTLFAVPHEKGAYLEGNIGTLYESFRFWGVNYSAFGSVGINTNLGYQFNRYLAAEMGYTNYGLGSNSLNNIDAAVKFIVPFDINGNDFSVFAKVGPAFVFESGNNSVLPLVGVGGSYSIDKHWDMNLQAQGVTDGFFSLGLLSAGLTYHFE